MSALFNFHSFLTVILLGICACTYFKMQFPAILEQRTGGAVKSVGIRRLLYDGCVNNLLLSYLYL
ncbi:hypothetical protein PIB30_071624 [Stylosanthes scabra]|uniref:Protein kish n=1 Tax=Stylosanthes scabra TaxID=79078 RepID=A0ABU6QNX3_9FABA|nr:hypothetical protein [Stylosanthes scabra]